MLAVRNVAYIIVTVFTVLTVLPGLPDGAYGAGRRGARPTASLPAAAGMCVTVLTCGALLVTVLAAQGDMLFFEYAPSPHLQVRWETCKGLLKCRS
jgi:hypothetical protein